LQYFFLDHEESIGYRLAFILMMCMAVMAIASAMGLKLYLTRSNRKLFRRSQENGTVYQPYLT
jgi:cytochrome c-type biogenesis protein CcmE